MENQDTELFDSLSATISSPATTTATTTLTGVTNNFIGTPGEYTIDDSGYSYTYHYNNGEWELHVESPSYTVTEEIIVKEDQSDIIQARKAKASVNPIMDSF